MSKHVSCSRCGLIWHDEDLDVDGVCPDCRSKPPPEPPPTDEEDP